MKHIIIILPSIFLLLYFSFRSEPKSFYQTWGFYDSQLSEDTLVFFTPDSKMLDVQIFQFESDGKIKYHVLRPIPRCGNNSFVFDTSSTWTRVTNSNEIIITWKGSYHLVSRFEMKGQYKLDVSKDKKLILIKTKSFYNKKMSLRSSRTS